MIRKHGLQQNGIGVWCVDAYGNSNIRIFRQMDFFENFPTVNTTKEASKERIKYRSLFPQKLLERQSFPLDMKALFIWEKDLNVT